MNGMLAAAGDRSCIPQFYVSPKKSVTIRLENQVSPKARDFKIRTQFTPPERLCERPDTVEKASGRGTVVGQSRSLKAKYVRFSGRRGTPSSKEVQGSVVSVEDSFRLGTIKDAFLPPGSARSAGQASAAR
jgi:hypothetical protein